VPPDAAPEKTIVEHTAINPNKAAHIGHLQRRSAYAGRVFHFRGTPVEVQNYIDDLGVQVADIVVGFREFSRTWTPFVRSPTTRFDYCTDLYARVTGPAPTGQTWRCARTLHDLEHGGMTRLHRP
jgi:arginyl-tRNA synthetase